MPPTQTRSEPGLLWLGRANAARQRSRSRRREFTAPHVQLGGVAARLSLNLSSAVPGLWERPSPPTRGRDPPLRPRRDQRNMEVRGGPSLPSRWRPTISSFPHRNHSGWTATEAAAPANRTAPQTTACITEKNRYFSWHPHGGTGGARPAAAPAVPQQRGQADTEVPPPLPRSPSAAGEAAPD